MESIATRVYRSIELYWRRRTYQKLEGSPSRKKRVVRLKRRMRKAIRILRPAFRLRVRLPWRTKLLTRLKDAYVTSMMALAGEKQQLPSVAGKKGRREAALGRRISKALHAGAAGGEFERRMMIHIYNSIMAPKQLR